MDANDTNPRDGGWGAMLVGVEGPNPDAGADAPRRDDWSVIATLVDRSSGGEAGGDRYARIVAQIGAFVPGELRDAAETLLHVAGGVGSWTGAVIDAPPRPPVATAVPDAASAPAPAGREREEATDPGPAPEREEATELAPAPERVPVTDDALPDDPTFEAAIAASPPAETRSR
jgi:hypothetical protein